METKEELKKIQELGVDAGQGYFLAKPAENLDIENIIRRIHNL
jgi:EAL domain-containing protein (putative c-di-GMP-specific phosphodiesterase class I)